MGERAAVGLAFLPLLLVLACGDSSRPETRSPTAVPPGEQALLELPFSRIVEDGFGAAGLTGSGGTLATADGSSYTMLGRLTGDLVAPEEESMVVFVEVRHDGISDGREGVYVIPVTLGQEREPAYEGAWVLTASGAGIVAEGADAEPFRQGAETLEGVTSISPILVLDLEGDGLEEIALLVRTKRQGVSFEHYDVYAREISGGWSRVEGKVAAPGLAALDYWANVGAATQIASRWTREERLRAVWPWLAQEGAAVDAEVLGRLAPEGEPEELKEVQEALIFLRTFFDEAHQRFSEGFQVRQPWQGFINGFKATDGVRLITMSPPEFDADSPTRATVDAVLDLTQREGEDPVVRTFEVGAETIQEGDEWYLDGVSAKERREE